MWWFMDNFFFCLVCDLLENYIHYVEKKDYCLGGLGALGEIILHGHAEWVETRDLTLGNFDSCLRIKITAL